MHRFILIFQVAVSDSPKNTKLHGANMALPIHALASLYAPGNITNVLAFVRRCYDYVRTKNQLGEYPQSFVSTLRTAETNEINRKLIAEITRAFLHRADPGAYHLLWEDQNVMVSHVIATNWVCKFESIICHFDQPIRPNIFPNLSNCLSSLVSDRRIRFWKILATRRACVGPIYPNHLRQRATGVSWEWILRVREIFAFICLWNPHQHHARHHDRFSYVTTNTWVRYELLVGWPFPSKYEAYLSTISISCIYSALECVFVFVHECTYISIITGSNHVAAHVSRLFLFLLFLVVLVVAVAVVVNVTIVAVACVQTFYHRPCENMKTFS